jgi:flagellar protein FlgJ
MTTPVSHADVYTDFQGLSALRAGARENSEASLREIAGQFEAIFIQMMLKSMRDANLGEGLMDSDHVKTYQSMFDQQIALDLSKRNSLGLADMMVQQLSRTQEGSSTLPADGAISNGPVQHALLQETLRRTSETDSVHSVSRNAPESAVSRDDWRPASPEAFVKALWPHAQRAADELGTRPELLISQAALETGWGKHMIRGADGSNSFNLFGIKADSRWQGERAVTETVEFRDGLMRKERAVFRAYASPEESFSDYAEFLKRNPRYQEALRQANDAPAFTRALSEAGYATDPDYSGKINRIMNSASLRETVSDIKEITREPLS